MPADRETDYWVAFSVFPGIGPVRFALLLSHFGSAKAAWSARHASLRETGLSERLVSEFDRFRRRHDAAGYRKRLEDLGVVPLILRNPKYPKLLAEISDAPFVLYVRGKRSGGPIDMAKTVGIVGARDCTPYGQGVAKRLATDLGGEGFTIVSGLAYGIDAVAHQAALDAGGKTIAVLGCGIDIVAPSVNARLYTAILQGGGALVSEMPLGHRPSKGLFPARNRIISGLSRGVVVVEGTEASGSLITARFAAEQGREVFAVPGPITSRNSAGPARLLKDGARLVTSADDILEEFGVSRRKAGLTFDQSSTGAEKKIVDALGEYEMDIDELARRTGLTISLVSATITILQMRGIVEENGNNIFALCS